MIDVREKPAIRGRNTEGFMGLIKPLRFCIFTIASFARNGFDTKKIPHNTSRQTYTIYDLLFT